MALNEISNKDKIITDIDINDFNVANETIAVHENSIQEKQLTKNQLKILNANVKIFDNAIKKIEKEGCVVRDAKGNVLIHPALDVQIKTAKLILEITKNT